MQLKKASFKPGTSATCNTRQYNHSWHLTHVKNFYSNPRRREKTSTEVSREEKLRLAPGFEPSTFRLTSAGQAQIASLWLTQFSPVMMAIGHWRTTLESGGQPTILAMARIHPECVRPVRVSANRLTLQSPDFLEQLWTIFNWFVCRIKHRKRLHRMHARKITCPRFKFTLDHSQ